MLGRPAAQMANAMWVKLQQYVPDILGRWCESTPGATALLMACGIVVGPKIATQVKLSRERKNATRARNMVHEQPQPIRPAVVETPKPPTPASMIWQEASNEK
jgi:hypothetical protein